MSPPRRSLTDAGAVALAAATAAACALARPVPLLVVGAVLVVAWVVRRPALLVVGVALLASGLAHGAVEGARPEPARAVDGVATLVTDPVRSPGSVRAQVRLDGRHYELVATGSAVGLLAPRLAGEELPVRGRTRPRRADDDWLERRHVVGHLDAAAADALGPARPGNPAAALANRYRRLLGSGASSLGPGEQALFTGFVFGDDRAIEPAVRFDFRAAGLGHLLAVSGANVAFVLAVAAPVLRRLGLVTRLAAAVGVLLLFAVLTRFEPSVLRATAMAIVATGATTFGWPISSARVLALATTAVLLLDPLLVGSLAFQLSVAASAGIILLARPIAERLPGPRAVAGGVGVAVAAQVAVAPILVPAFGGVAVVAVPANVLAAPAAGPVMVWGLTAGTLAGVAGGPVASVLHVPTGVLLAWVATVARVAASAPVGELGPAHLLALAGIVAIGALGTVVGRRWGPIGRGVAVAGAVACVLAAAVARPSPEPGGRELVRGAELVVTAAGGRVLLVDGRVRTDSLLERLRAEGIDHLDLLVVRSGSGAAGRAARALLERVPATAVLAPEASSVPGAREPEPGTVVAVPGAHVQVDRVGERVDVSVVAGAGVASAGARSRRRRVPHHLGPRGPPLRHHAPGGGDGHPQPHARLLLRQGQLLGLRRLPP